MPLSGAPGPPETLSLQSCLGQSRTEALAEDIIFKLSECGQQAGHGSTHRRRQIESFRQRHEAHAQCGWFFQCHDQIGQRAAPSIQSPQQYDVNLSPPRGVAQAPPGFTLRGARTNFSDLNGDRPASPGGIFPHGAVLHSESLLVVCGHAGRNTYMGVVHFGRGRAVPAGPAGLDLWPPQRVSCCLGVPRHPVPPQGRCGAHGAKRHALALGFQRKSVARLQTQLIAQSLRDEHPAPFTVPRSKRLSFSKCAAAAYLAKYTIA